MMMAVGYLPAAAAEHWLAAQEFVRRGTPRCNGSVLQPAAASMLRRETQKQYQPALLLSLCVISNDRRWKLFHTMQTIVQPRARGGARCRTSCP